MSYELKGEVKVIRDTQVVSDKFKKREIVLIDDSGQYPQTIQMEAIQDKVSLFDSLNEGDRVTVSWNLNGREWINPQGEAKVFNTLQIWKVESTTETKPTTETDMPF